VTLRRSALRALLLAGAAWTCASPVAPPGGPEDELAPRVLGVSPDSGSVRVTPDALVIRFDEVISETPQGARDLAQRVIVSPSEGPIQVRWQRDRLRIRPKAGWRANTAYVVTLLPGVTDLSSNSRDSSVVVVFSTGGAIPAGHIDGVVFDWTKSAPAPRALVQARPLSDTTLVYATEADSTGRFTLPILADGAYQLLALLDQNRNALLDPRELWDTVTVSLRDSARTDFYVFPQDTLPPKLLTVTAVDTLTLRLTFDRPLAPVPDYTGSVRLFDPDSQPLPFRRVRTAAAEAAERIARDSIRRDSTARARAAADTTAAGRAARERARQDSLNRAQAIADSIAADTAPRRPRPVSAREALSTELVLDLAGPLQPQQRYVIEAQVTGANRRAGSSARPFTPARPPATRADSSAAADSTPPPGRRPPPAGGTR
jgi:hypothetical protein